MLLGGDPVHLGLSVGRDLLRGRLGPVGVLAGVLRAAEHAVVVIGDRLQGADPVEQVVRGAAGQHRLQRAEPLAGVCADGDRADPVARLGQRGLSRGEALGRRTGRLLLGGQLLPRLVELLGEHFEVVRAGGDELRRVLRRGGPGFGRGRGREESHDAGGGDRGEDPATGRGQRTRHGRRSSFLPRPPTELADGFGREGARLPTATLGRRSLHPGGALGPRSWPASCTGGWFGGARTAATWRDESDRPDGCDGRCVIAP